MAKRKQPADNTNESPAGGQVNFRADADLWAALQDVSNVLGVDIANLARMIIKENLQPYQERADRIRPKKASGAD